jgi:hypothetical protein
MLTRRRGPSPRRRTALGRRQHGITCHLTDTQKHGPGKDVALYTTASVDAIVPAHPEVGWEQLHTVEKGRRSPPATLAKQAAAA